MSKFESENGGEIHIKERAFDPEELEIVFKSYCIDNKMCLFLISNDQNQLLNLLNVKKVETEKNEMVEL